MAQAFLRNFIFYVVTWWGPLLIGAFNEDTSKNSGSDFLKIQGVE